jgi:uncharacterized protein YjbJ (UPF0337 family)
MCAEAAWQQTSETQRWRSPVYDAGRATFRRQPWHTLGWGARGKDPQATASILLEPGTRRCAVGEKTDEAKGKIKEAAGVLSGDKGLKREGKADQAGAKVKEKAGEAVDKVKDIVKDD